MKKTLLLLLAGLSSAFSQTIVPDLSQVSGNWTLAGSPYVILGRATVAAGQTLTIDPGVTIKFTSNTNLTDTTVWQPDSNVVGRLRVDGKIIANGTVTDTIYFTGNNVGYWGSVYLTSLADTTSAFSYCKFSYLNKIGGYNGATFEFHNGLSFEKSASYTILHCCFESNQFTITDEMSSRIINIGFCNFRNNYHTTIGNFLQTTAFYTPPVYIYNSVFINSALGGRRLTIVNSILQNSDSIAIISADGGPATCTVINSLLYNNPRAFQGQCLFKIYNSILLNNLAYDTMVFNCGLNWQLEKTVFDGAIYGTWATSTSNFPFTNPSLVNPSPTNGDFHLLGSSICINSGDTTGISNLIPSTDLDGNPRYNGVIDIGPYEYQIANSVPEFSYIATTIYPNPTKNILNIEAEQIQGVIRIFDVLGNELMIDKFSKKAQLNVEELQPGMYYIQLQGSEKSISRGFVKQ